MKNKHFSLFVVAVILLACEPAVEDPFELFIIPSGKHYCQQRHAEALQTNVLQFAARFDASASYTFANPMFQDSKNKLLGFSDCNALHHDNSARFAWAWIDDKIEISAYCYVDGHRVEQFLGTTSIGTVDQYRIDITDEAYVFFFRDERVVIQRGTHCQGGVYMMLWPYFGGQLVAPHDVTIAIRRF